MRLLAPLSILALPLLGWAVAQPPALPPNPPPTPPSPADHAAALEALQPKIIAHWEGAAELTPGQFSRVIVDVIGPHAGTITLPDRDVLRLPLSDVDIDGDHLRFVCMRLNPRIHISYDLQILPDGLTASGKMKQGDRVIPLTLKRSGMALPVSARGPVGAPVKSVAPGAVNPESSVTLPAGNGMPASSGSSTVSPTPPAPFTPPDSSIDIQPHPQPGPPAVLDLQPLPPPLVLADLPLPSSKPPEPDLPAPAKPTPLVKPAPAPAPVPPPAPLPVEVKPAPPSKPAPAPQPASSPMLTGTRWEGVARVTANITLPLTIDVYPPDHASLSIPKQLVHNQPLSSIALTTSSMRFAFAPSGMSPSLRSTFDLTIADGGQSASGTMTQMGDTMPVTLRRAGDAPPIAAPTPPPAPPIPGRPQTPRPPFPYEAREVSFKNPASGGTLAGTLTMPRIAGNHPALLLITGSGLQDRDETILNHKPFAVIADHLTRAGYAVLRVDDPGVGGSTNTRGERATTDDFVTDASAAFDFLKQQPGVDPARTGLAGHSEGGVIAPMLASTDHSVAFIILLAGTGVPGGELLTAQTAALTKASGISDEQAAPMLAAHQAVMQALRDNLPDDQLTPLVRTLTQRQLELNAPGRTFSDKELDAVVTLGMKQITSPWLRRFAALDPRGYLANVSCPVLILSGDKDTQVPTEQNVPVMVRALNDGGNRDVTARFLPSLNHLFQPAVTGSPAEYGSIETTIDPSVLALLVEWLNRVTAPPARP